MFVSEAGVKEQVDQMEIRYLSNPGGHVRFALLSDWSDADQETMPNDDQLLNIAATAVAALNTKYGEQRFFVFHRKRLWNPAEGKWMGWERKRGKLHEFNRLLRGAADTSFLPIDGKPAEAPPGVCYVITLDADTKLPMGVVSQLVGVAAHPLNQPVFDPITQCVVDGYGILQPRVTSTLPHRQEHSMFHRIFAGASGTDAYSSSVSELYQDLFALGTYSGKGLYHVDTFEAALAGRVPENTQLSHDLFESVYARCALVNDIEFFDEFPSHTEVAASREHRWTRGDWQLLPWIFGPRGKGMPMIGRWKMLDNLRRSLSAPGALFALVATWAIPDAPQAMLIGLVLTALAFPAIMTIISGFTLPRRGISLVTHVRVVGENVLWAIGQQPGGVDVACTTRLADDGRHRPHPGAAIHYPASIAQLGHRPAGKISGRSHDEEAHPVPGQLVYNRHRRRCCGAAFQSGWNQGRCTFPAVMVAGAGRRSRLEPARPDSIGPNPCSPGIASNCA